MTPSKKHSLDIRLPEGVVLSLALAGPATRFLAWLIDLILTLAVIQAIETALRSLTFMVPDIGGGLQVIVYFATPIFYGILFEGWWRGQTPGKRALRLRVMDAGGLRLDGWQVAVRNLLRVVDSLPLFYLVGGTACLFSRRAQRLGDLAAGTVVVRTERALAPDLTQLASGKYNTLRDHPVLAARLRQRISPEEAGLALRAILRRNVLEPTPRAELFAQLAARFRAAVPLPEELAMDLDVGDEQYVRNVVDVLFHTRGKAGAK